MATRNGDYMILNGKLVPFAEARVHCLSPAITSSVNVFEGLRAYWNPEDEQLHVFRLEEHLARLEYSARVMRIGAHPWDRDTLREMVCELLRVNEARESVHMRIHLYVDEDGFMTATEPVGMFISCVFRPSTRQSREGCTAQVSSWTRLTDNSGPPRVKSSANYFNGRLAAIQAKQDGYDNAILLTPEGHVSEGPGACIFLIRDGVPSTPDRSQHILESITRDTLITGFSEWFGNPVQERAIGRSELYAAQEVFFCGTGNEITPVIGIDGLAVGEGRVGPITAALQERYFAIASGRDAAHPEWRTPVYGRP